MRQLKITQVRHNASKVLQMYFVEINKVYDIDEVDLSNKIQQGDKQALELLVKANLKFVVSVAKQYLYYGAPLEDLIDEGNIGLIKAAHKYDNSRGFKFISYAVWHIRQSILEYLQKYNNIVKIPLNIQTDLNNLKKLVNTTEQELGIEMTYSVANATIDDPKLERLFSSHGKKDVSLDAPVGDDNNFTLLDNLSADSSFDSDSLFNKNETIEILNKAIATLSRVEQQIINLTFGLNNRAALTMYEICKECGIYDSRYNKLFRSAKKKIARFITDYNQVIDTDNIKPKPKYIKPRETPLNRAEVIKILDNDATERYINIKVKKTQKELQEENKSFITKNKRQVTSKIKVVDDEIILDHYFGRFTGYKSTIAGVAIALNISKSAVHTAVQKYELKQQQKRLEQERNIEQEKKGTFFNTIKNIFK